MDNDAKIRAGYNYLKNNVTYIDWRESTYANTAYGALVEHKAACSGMTRAFVAMIALARSRSDLPKKAV